MLRGGKFGCSVLLASHIPRSVWDPLHHNPNWTDSYGTEIASRRQWPAKKWSVGLEPRTPSEWLQFSKRNLAYAYNGAMRACQTFPEMLVLYREMKQREVKVDVDTMNLLLTRGVRHGSIAVDDLFLLFEELVQLGARPDMAAVETLQTILEFSAGMSVAWKEIRRREIVEWYNVLALEVLERFKPSASPNHAILPPCDPLLVQQISRIRRNLESLSASLSPHFWRQYLPLLQSSSLLLQELHFFLWELVRSDHPATTLPPLRMRVPFVGSVMKRPPLPSPNSTSSPVVTDFEDTDVCSVFLAALERVVEADFRVDQAVNPAFSSPLLLRRLFLSLLAMLEVTGVFYTAPLMAQFMDVVKYSQDDATRDGDAIRVLRYSLRGTSASQQADYQRLWRSLHPPADGRVVGRYIASRHPWTMACIYVDPQRPTKQPAPWYPAACTLPQRRAKRQSSGEAQEAEKGEAEAAPPAVASFGPASVEPLRTAEAFDLRWNDVQRLVHATGAIAAPAVLASLPAELAEERAAASMEVFTGEAVFLRVAATGQRYEALDTALATQAQGGAEAPTSLFSTLPFATWRRILSCVVEVHRQMESFINVCQSLPSKVEVEPELECWESLLVCLRCSLDYCAAVQHKRNASTEEERDATDDDEQAVNEESIEALFKEAAALRARLIEESRTRFGGRMKILWLHEL